MSEDFIRFENVKKVYHTGEVELTALHDVSFSIARGEICVIVGESGAGKTTLLNILGGMDTLTEGRIVVDGEEVSAFDERRLTTYRRCDVGFVFQFYNLIPNLTALENIELAARLGREPADAAEVLAQVGLRERAQNFPSQLSGGEQQRVCVARALINHPELILADEPTGNLDEANENIVLDLFRQLHKEGTTLIVVTHDPEVAEAAQRTIVLEHGKVAREVINENFGK